MNSIIRYFLRSGTSTATVGCSTAVHGVDLKRSERVMIDKLFGKVANAVISYGGFLGMGEDFYPTVV